MKPVLVNATEALEPAVAEREHVDPREHVERVEGVLDLGQAVPLHTFERPGTASLFDLDGWQLLRRHATIVFADGGSLKSYLALYGAGRLAQRNVRVLFVIGNSKAQIIASGWSGSFGAEMPTVHYLRCERPLVNEASRIGREVRRLSIDYLICNSIGFATSGPPEAAEHATATFRAVRHIGVGSLHLAHVTKSEGRGNGKNRLAVPSGTTPRARPGS